MQEFAEEFGSRPMRQYYIVASLGNHLITNYFTVTEHL